ncbi:MAG: hydroxylamine oxidoreductase, partial [Gemmatimonadota bacterium]
MTLETKRVIIAALGGLFLLSLVFVQRMETARKAEEAGLRDPHVSVPSDSRACVDCHAEENPGIVSHWTGSTHAERGVGCYGCHQADIEDADSYLHHGVQIATIVTPLDCAN